MRTRLLGTTLALVLPAATLAAGCSSSKKTADSKAKTGSNSVVTAKTANTIAAPAPPAPATKTTFATTAGHQYTLIVTPQAPSNKAACTSAANNGAIVIPFTVAIQNNSGDSVPQPWLGLAAQPGSPQTEVPAMSVDGTCIDFTLTKNTMQPNATVTYNGSYSNASAKSVLLVRLNDAKAGTPGQINVPLFKG